MCRMCEGFSLEDVIALEAAALQEYGFIVTGVDGAKESPGITSWCYTVGLLDAVGHPELIVAGPSVERGGRLLSRLGRRVLAGTRFLAGDRIRAEGGRVHVGAVHPAQYELDAFNVWHNLRAAGALHAPELEALQIFVPPTWFCSCHRQVQPDLSDQAARVDRPAA